MRDRHALEKWLAMEVWGREIGRKPPGSARRETPERDWKYRAWIRTLPSAVSGSTRWIEACHTGSDGGLRQKSSDLSCVPLTALEHREYHQIGRQSFARKYNVNFERLVRRLNRTWRRINRSAA